MKYITESGTERTCVCPDKEITKEIKINEL